MKKKKGRHPNCLSNINIESQYERINTITCKFHLFMSCIITIFIMLCTYISFLLFVHSFVRLVWLLFYLFGYYTLCCAVPFFFLHSFLKIVLHVNRAHFHLPYVNKFSVEIFLFFFWKNDSEWNTLCVSVYWFGSIVFWGISHALKFLSDQIWFCRTKWNSKPNQTKIASTHVEITLNREN